MSMYQFNPQPEISPTVLATDLDGTFIPLDECGEQKDALSAIASAHGARRLKLVYVTGRHHASVMEAIASFGLPVPEWIISDVGTSIYQPRAMSGDFDLYAPYEEYLKNLVQGKDRAEIETLLENISGLQMQSPERQNTFKISYECQAEQLDRLLSEIHQRLSGANMPYACIGSVDPFEECGLLDVLPAGVSKASALIWLSSHADFSPDEVVFSGDSGNDLAALVSGFRAIIVGNASQTLADKAMAQLEQRGLGSRLYRARGHATSGVLEGCRHFGLL